MPTCISLLRGINISGHRTLRMAELRAGYERLGLTAVRTYLQSGNVVFATPRRVGPRLAADIERMIRRDFGHDVDVLLRGHADLARIIAANPYKAAAKSAPAKVAVVFLGGRPPGTGLAALADIPSGQDVFTAGTTELYLHCPGGFARSKLSHTVIERRLGVIATARNWRTVTALSEMSR